MKMQTRVNKAMQIPDECKRLLALDGICLMIAHHGAAFYQARAEIERLEAAGIKRVCKDGRIYAEREGSGTDNEKRTLML